MTRQSIKRRISRNPRILISIAGVIVAVLTMANAASAADPANSSPAVPAPASRTVVVPGVPRFFNYLSPLGVADAAGEPNLGINWTTELTFSNSNGPIPNGGISNFFGGFMNHMAKVTFDDCQSPAKATWEKKPLLLASTTRAAGDPILYTDRETGRTFVSQLEGLTPAGSTTDITDNDGDSFSPSEGSGLPSCVDHQTLGGGHFHAPLFSPLYPNAVYYASQCIADATCSLSLDGGVTFGEGVPMFTVADCAGLHGHLKVAPDGTIYVPDKACKSLGVPLLLGGNASVVVSEDNGLTWTLRPVNSPLSVTKGDDDPSVGTASDGTIYLGWQSSDGHARIAVSHDKGANWVNIRDVGASLGIQNMVFPEVAAGDPNRAAFSFYGTTTAGTNYNQPAFTGDWYLYIAVTFDGGNTWTTQNVTPGDPVQRRSGVCGSGTCRNQLDFYDMAVDKEGRVVVGWDDGCIGACATGGANSFSSKGVITRQSGGMRMFAAYDPVEPRIPEAPGVTAALEGTLAHLTWQPPDNGGADITGYNIYRSVNGAPYTLLVSLAGTEYFDPVNTANTNNYHVRAVNLLGEGPYCHDISPVVDNAPTACLLPGILTNNDLNPDATDADAGQNIPPDPSVNVRQLHVAEPYLGPGVNQLVFTMNMAPGGILTPSSQWYIIWNRKTIAADKSDRRFVAMKTDASNVLSFVYGDFGPPLPLDGSIPPVNANTPLVLGAADFGSFDAATGLMTIKLSDAHADGGAGLAAGDDLPSLNVRTYLARPDAGQKSQNNASDITANGSYHLVGNASCFCTVDEEPLAALSTSPTSGVVPLLVNFDASASSDPDLTDGVGSYALDYGDGTPPVTQGSPLFSHTYGFASGPGGYAAKLTVKDQLCGKSSLNIAAVNIQVADSPTATQLSLVSAEAKPGRVSLQWYTSDSQIGSATVYRRSASEDWRALATVAPDGTGMIYYLDTSVLGGTQYSYRIGTMQDGQEVYSREQWVTVPRIKFRIMPVANPSRQQVDFTLVLDQDGQVHVQVFSPAGRRVADLVNAWMPAGTHTLHWGNRGRSGSPGAGVYVVQAKSGGRAVATRVVLLQ